MKFSQDSGSYSEVDMARAMFDKRDEARREQWQKLRKADARHYIAAQLLAAHTSSVGLSSVDGCEIEKAVRVADALLLELAK